ncbi:MAG: right-handed parallel beta-helix repeat-containing protein [Kiritimatiellae bacterium]|nr:right-handed parallel beta-helix repeat-containing protein [Kiritimatiellia bacterium]
MKYVQHLTACAPRTARLHVAVIAATLGRAVLATEFDDFAPDKTGTTNVAPLLQEAVRVAAKSDRILILAPGRYWIAEPVVIQGNGFTLSARFPVTACSVVLSGYGAHVPMEARTGTNAPARPEALVRVLQSYSLTIAGISFEHAIAGIEGAPFIAASRIERCGFTHCDFGIAASPIQVVTIGGCTFYDGRFGVRGGERAGPSLDRSNLVNIYDCVFRQMTEWGIQVEGSPTNVRDCNFESSSGGAVELLDCYVANVTGGYFEGCGRNSPALISVAKSQLDLGGQLNLFGNQINVNGAPSLIRVGKGLRLHAYDNRVNVSHTTGQRFVTAEDAPGPSLRYENNVLDDPAVP